MLAFQKRHEVSNDGLYIRHICGIRAMPLWRSNAEEVDVRKLRCLRVIGGEIEAPGRSIAL